MTLKEAVLAYDAALSACANDPEKMSPFCTAEGQDLDAPYDAMLEAAQAPQPKGSAPLPATLVDPSQALRLEPVAADDERVRFEAWQVSLGRPRHMLAIRTHGIYQGCYADNTCEAEWSAWQARAALATKE